MVQESDVGKLRLIKDTEDYVNVCRHAGEKVAETNYLNGLGDEDDREDTDPRETKKK